MILSYISIATMVGPWIAPTLVLLGHSLLSMRQKKSTESHTETLAWMQAIGAGGGIIATGVGFALPMLYFLDPITFNTALASPIFFCSIITIICLVAGGFGLLLGRWWKTKFLNEQTLPFPVSNLTYQTITAQTQPQQTSFFMLGTLGTLFVCLIRDGIWRLHGFIDKTYYIFPSLLAKEAALSIWPSLWAIGFSVGLSITIPLFVGLISKYIIIYPLVNHAHYLPFKLFDSIPVETFTIAFCSGLVLCELILSLPGHIKKWYGLLHNRITTSQLLTKARNNTTLKNVSAGEYAEIGLILVSTIALLTYFKFSLLAQILLIGFTIIATSSICYLGGKIGMIPFGRFSTFVVVPLLLLFNLSPVQATLTCVFFNICAASASDLLFDYKIGQLCSLDQKRMYRYQWIGLVATAFCLGIILWLLFTHLQLGSETFFAQRGKAKALLLQSLNFDTYIVLLGFLFGWFLKKIKINPTMVFGGLIMPNSISIGLIIGSMCTKLTQNPARLQPLCAGILAAESLWILLVILGKML